MEELVERVRKELFANLTHYRQRCSFEKDDAETVARFVRAEIKKVLYELAMLAEERFETGSGAALDKLERRIAELSAAP